MFTRFFQIGLVTTFSMVLILACSKKTTAPATQKPYQGPEISYASDVAPIIKRSCSPCHFPEQKGKKDPLDSYKRMQKEIMEVIARVEMDEDNIKRVVRGVEELMQPPPAGVIGAIRNPERL